LTNNGYELTGLFQAPPAGRRGFPAFAISTALHGCGVAMVTWALLHQPAIIRDSLSRNYKVRHLQFEVPESSASRAAEALYPNQEKTGKPAAQQDVQAQPAPHPRSPAALRLAEGGKGKQILVQPEMHTEVATAAEVPLPNVLVWTPEVKPAETIVPPKPEPLAEVDVQTSLNVPNEELQLADLPLASADRTPAITTAPAGSSTPIAVHGLNNAKTAPATASAPADQSTPAAILSVSDLRMNSGTAALPPANETRGDMDKQGAEAGQQAFQNGIGDVSNESGGESSEHIELPKDGRFGVVVVGTSLSDQFPETLQVWSDRVAYTAYLHVGTPKAWILQYAQLREADASAGGAVAHLDAPWPYDILRPNLLSKDLSADALMVHGVLNEAGRLVNLAIAYPEGYIHGSYVLHELQQWLFRPAQQRGKPTAVEVLLIIPEND
jgi:hypothetical protein